MPQLNVILELLPDLERVLRKRGEEPSRPNYDDDGPSTSDRENRPVPHASRHTRPLEERRDPESYNKKNFEATSDEDEKDSNR